MANAQPLPHFPAAHTTPAALDEAAYASWGRRLGAFVIDGLLIYVAAIIISAATGHHTPLNVLHVYTSPDGTKHLQPVGSKLVFYGGVSVVLNVVYTAMFLAAKGNATLGMRWVGIFLANEWALDRIGPARAVGRTALFPGLTTVIQLALPVTGLLFIVDFLWPLWDDENQTLHDKLAKTVVLRRHEGR